MLCKRQTALTTTQAVSCVSKNTKKKRRIIIHNNHCVCRIVDVSCTSSSSATSWHKKRQSLNERNACEENPSRVSLSSLTQSISSHYIFSAIRRRACLHRPAYIASNNTVVGASSVNIIAIAAPFYVLPHAISCRSVETTQCVSANRRAHRDKKK